jgi:hypothetical protein
MFFPENSFFFGVVNFLQKRIKEDASGNLNHLSKPAN